MGAANRELGPRLEDSLATGIFTVWNLTDARTAPPNVAPEFPTPEGRGFGAEWMETMALKGKPRDMNKWREVLLDPNVHFPGESNKYRRARNELLEAEAELRRMNEQVAAQRRALPAGGLIREDYVFESAADGSKVRFWDAASGKLIAPLGDPQGFDVLYGTFSLHPYASLKARSMPF